MGLFSCHLHFDKISISQFTMTTTSPAPETAKKRIYVGNLANTVLKDDLVQLFGLGTTPYLRTSCDVEIAVCEKTNKSKNFAFVTVPEHVHAELIKLNGIEFYGKQLVIEEAKTPKDSEDQNQEKKKTYKGNNRRGGNRRSGNRRWNGGKSKFNLPTLEPDQVFHLVDCGVNLTNPKF